MGKRWSINIKHPTFRQWIGLRLIGFGVLCLTKSPVRNILIYFGSIGNLGAWVMAENKHTEIKDGDA